MKTAYDRQDEKGPQRAHRAVRGRLEREPPLAPAECEERDGPYLQHEAERERAADAEAHSEGPNPVGLVRGVVRRRRGRVQGAEEQRERRDEPPGDFLERPEEGPASKRTQDAEAHHVREDIRPRDALPAHARVGVRDA